MNNVPKWAEDAMRNDADNELSDTWQPEPGQWIAGKVSRVDSFLARNRSVPEITLDTDTGAIRIAVFYDQFRDAIARSANLRGMGDLPTVGARFFARRNEDRRAKSGHHYRHYSVAIAEAETRKQGPNDDLPF